MDGDAAADFGSCNIRAAIALAESQGGGVTIYLHSLAVHFITEGTNFVSTTGISILSADDGPVTIDGSGNDARFIDLYDVEDYEASLTFGDVFIFQHFSGDEGASNYGGVIYASYGSQLVIGARCQFLDNTGGWGGVILVSGQYNPDEDKVVEAQLTVGPDCAFERNIAHLVSVISQ